MAIGRRDLVQEIGRVFFGRFAMAAQRAVLLQPAAVGVEALERRARARAKRESQGAVAVRTVAADAAREQELEQGGRSSPGAAQAVQAASPSEVGAAGDASVNDQKPRKSVSTSFAPVASSASGSSGCPPPPVVCSDETRAARYEEMVARGEA